MNEKTTILLTGATGFLGKHLLEVLVDYQVTTLGRAACSDYILDLESDTAPVPGLPYFDAVIHAAGTAEEGRAEALNLQGTRRLLKALEANPPRHLTFISSVHVYGNDPGEEVTEDTFLRPHTPYSRSKIKAEKECERWCAEHGVELTILRPAVIAGDGMHGALADMAEGVRKGRYFHIRGVDVRRSLVMAYDAARVVVATLELPGIYNVCDGANRTVKELADAMTRNYGTDKRLFTLPLIPLKTAACIAAIFPPLRRWISDDKLTRLMTSTTFSNKKICDATGLTFHDTVEVIARRDPDYPYKDE